MKWAGKIDFDSRPQYDTDGLVTTIEVDTISGSLQTNIDGKSDISHIHDDRYYTSSEVDDLITTISGNLDDHNELNNLDYADSGHTGFSPTSHSHTESDISDLDKYTQSEVDTISGSLQTNIDGKADTVHTHDDRYYTESEVDTISGTLQTDIDTKPDTEVFLTEGVPSNAIGVLNDIAIDQETGTIYEKVISTDSATFYPAVSGDDVLVKDNGDFYSNAYLAVGEQNATTTWDSSVRFPNVTIPNGATIVSAYIKFTAYSDQSGTICKTNCYFNNVDNAVAPTNASEYNALVVTSPVVWDGIGAWTNGTQYDTIELKTILQTVIDRGGWASGQAVQFLIKDNSSDNNARREMSSIDDVSGTEKPELHITWGDTAIWEEKLSPDFLKLSDTPTTYSGVSGKYLKTTNSGIEFVEDLYTKSEVDTISGTLQTNIDGKSDTSHIHDDRYYTESEVDTISGSLQANIDGKSDTAHIHDDRYYTESEIDDLITTISGKFDDHNELNNLDYASSGHTGFQPTGDYLTDSEFSTYSGTLQLQIDGKSDTAHTHDDRYYTESEVDTISGSLQTNIDGKSDTSHIHDDRYYTESEVDALITTISGKLDDHNELNNLDYASSGHTGFQPAGDYATTSNLTAVSGALQTNIDEKSDIVHLHDDRYYTETELNNGQLDNRYYTESETDTISGSLNTKIDGKSDTIHFHDDRYYTESEVGTISGSLQSQIDNKSDISHLHDDRYYTESEIDTISGTLQTNIDSKSDTAHIHDDRYYTETEIDDLITTISGKLDDHNELNNLDYVSSGHTGFQQAGDYATNPELTSVSGALQTNIDGKSDISHTHDDRYYTETELNTGQLDNRYYTESEVDTISGSLRINIDGKADVSHTHDDRYYTESEVDDLITTISGKLDDHNELNNLDYASSGHTGFQPSGDYLTDSEFSTYSGTLQNNINSHASNHTDGTDDIQSATNTQKGLATSAQIIAIEANTAHKTSTGADHSYIDQTVVSGTDPTFVGTNITEIPSANLYFNVIGDPTYKTAQDWFDVIQSSGILEGFVLSNSRLSTELDVSAGKGIIKETDSELGATVSFETSAVENITLTSDNTNYIYVDYNAGTPQIVATTNRASIELNRMFIIGRTYKNGADLYILNAGVHISNLARSEHERLVERDGFTYTSGSVTSETGTLNLDITAGVWYLGHNRVTTDPLNSDTGGDTWVYTHYGAASWITDNATTSAVDCTHYNAGTDALGTLGTNNYGTQWIYITADSHWYIIYGTQNGQLTSAEDASPPVSIPTYIETMGELIAKMIVKQDGTIVGIQSVHAITFTPAGITNHNETGGLQGGAANEYYHLTSAQHVDLTDGGDSTSHKHDDRYYIESEVDTISGSLNTKIDGKITNVSEDTTPELGGQLGVGEHDIKLDALLSADGKYSGTTRDGVLGATLAFGDLVYLNTTDQRWELCDADAETTSGDVDLAIVLAAGNDGDTRLLLIDGFVREDDWNFTSYGQALYVSTTAGDMTQDVSGYTTGDIVRVVGKAGTTANEIHFKPSQTWIELS